MTLPDVPNSELGLEQLLEAIDIIIENVLNNHGDAAEVIDAIIKAAPYPHWDEMLRYCYVSGRLQYLTELAILRQKPVRVEDQDV